ncbi:MAG: DUF1592 domain-containing protein [Porticoccaceae bacterium]|nr:DUF1592 domain-containing protein [Porticoccaceae bacterium]
MPSSKGKSGISGKLTAIAVVVAAVVAGAVSLFYLDREAPVHAGPPTVKLISQPQYANTIVALFGEDIEVPRQFPPINRTEGLLSLGNANTAITPVLVERFYRYGQSVANQVLAPARRDYFMPCVPADGVVVDAVCAKAFISSIGRHLYRRPLTEAEVTAYVAAADQAAKNLENFYEGLSYVLAAMLAAPEFVFIWDSVEADPEKPGEYRLDAYSKASRLSFFLWNSPPDELLLQAAERGDLHTSEGLNESVERMLGSPKIDLSIRGFFADMLHFDEFENLAKDMVIYPSYGPGVSRDAAEQMLQMITSHLVDRRADYRELFTTRMTYMSNALAAIYRIPINPSREFVPYEFAEDSGRTGLLTQVGFLSMHSHPGRSSPTIRGEGVRETLLCQPVPLPPPNVDFSNFEDPAGDFKTARQRLVRHSSDPACANCHMITDPIGLGLENFDGAGQFRLTENGAVIDASGELDGIAFSDPASLGEAMRDNPATTACLVERLFAYGINRPTEIEDTVVIERLEKQFSYAGYRVPDLMKTIVLDKAFFAVSLEAETAPDEVASVH